MTTHEAHRIRHLVIRLEKGDEIPGAILRALDGTRSGFLTGVGTLERASLRQSDGAEHTLGAPREVVSLTGTVGTLSGNTDIRLTTVLSHATDTGLSTCGGQLIYARVLTMVLHVQVFDDLELAESWDPVTKLLGYDVRPRPVTPAAAAEPPRPPAPSPSPPPVAAIPLPPAPPPPPAHASAPTLGEGPALPQKPQRPKENEDVENYPEQGDRVIHFAFGECTVVSSEGDRIKLRQDREGRVLDVALTMLRIEPLDTTEDGKRHFRLQRKN